MLPEIAISSFLSVIVECTAVCTMWFGDWYDFYIVEKEVDEETDLKGNKKKADAVNIV